MGTRDERRKPVGDIYLVVIHPPQLDLPVVCPAHYERHGGMEVRPVDAPVVTLQHVLHHGVRLAEQVRSVGVLLDVILQSPPARTRGHGLLPEAGDVPDPDGLVEAGGDDHVLAGVELGAHHVVVVPGQHADALPGLPVPDTDSLVVAGDKELLAIMTRN